MSSIDSASRAFQIPEGFTELVEGSAKILRPVGNKVFYNKAQVVNRDLSVAAIQAFGDMRASEADLKKKPRWKRPLRILEALSATGLRSIRYWKEIPNVERIIANDLDHRAVETIRQNVEFNGISAEDQIIPNCADARLFMYEHASKLNALKSLPKKSRDTMGDFPRIDVIDLDPYGTAAPFLEPAIESIEDGGLLLVTSTDMRCLAGAMQDSCFSKYASIPIKRKYRFEMALRIILNMMSTTASRHKKIIVPLFSAHIDFYVRIFVRVFSSGGESLHAALKQGLIYQCVDCDHYQIQPLAMLSDNKLFPARGPPVDSCCPHCKGQFQVGGPIWTGLLHDHAFLDQLTDKLQADSNNFTYAERVLNLIRNAQAELPEIIGYYDLPSLCHRVHCAVPPAPVFRSAIVNAGYRVSQSHCDPNSLKTDAPMKVIWDLIRCWVKENPVKRNLENTPGGRILEVKPKISADWTILDSQRRSAVGKFALNPEKDWGPKSRAGTKRAAQEDPNKSQEEILRERSLANFDKKAKRKARRELAEASD